MHVSSGSQIIDDFLEGGYENDIITTLFGPAGSGKTNLALLAAVNVAKSGKKVIYIDTEGSFSVARFKQIVGDDTTLIDNFIFMRPTTFDEQKRAMDRLKDANFDPVGMIVVDSIAMLYRLEKGRTEVYDVNKDLGLQIGVLTEIARKHKIPVVVTNQVYSSFEEKDRVHMVGGDILKYGSKCLIELQLLNNKRVAVLRKHRSMPEGKSVLFKIINEGVVSADEHPQNPPESTEETLSVRFE